MNLYLSITRLRIGDEIKVYYHLALLFDFMFFCAQSLRRVLGDRTPTIPNLAGARALFLESTHLMDVHIDSVSWSDHTRCMRSIASKVAPVPLPDTDHVEHMLATPNKYRRKRDCTDFISPELRRENIPSAKFQRYETIPVRSRPRFPNVNPAQLSSVRSAKAGAQAESEELLFVGGLMEGPPSEEHHNKLIVCKETMNNLHAQSRIIFDSDCSISGTANLHDLTDLRACGPLQVSGAFGPSTQAAHSGKLGPLGLDAIVIPGLGHQTLVSLSLFCEGGDSGKKFVGLFTHADFRIFEIETILPEVSLIAQNGVEVVRGTVQNGIYVQDSC
jgi:hypothetical protein